MSQLSDQIVQISTRYLGPAARIFLERQANAHMSGLSFDQIERTHLADLAYWIEVSAALLIDKSQATELAQKVRAL